MKQPAVAGMVNPRNFFIFNETQTLMINNGSHERKRFLPQASYS